MYSNVDPNIPPRTAAAGFASASPPTQRSICSRPVFDEPSALLTHVPVENKKSLRLVSKAVFAAPVRPEFPVHNLVAAARFAFTVVALTIDGSRP